MELRKPNWEKISLCLDYLLLLDRKIEEPQIDNKQIGGLSQFYFMAFNIAYYEFVLAYSHMTAESADVTKEHFDKFKEEDKENGGFFNGGFKI